MAFRTWFLVEVPLHVSSTLAVGCVRRPPLSFFGMRFGSIFQSSKRTWASESGKFAPSWLVPQLTRLYVCDTGCVLDRLSRLQRVGCSPVPRSLHGPCCLSTVFGASGDGFDVTTERTRRGPFHRRPIASCSEGKDKNVITRRTVGTRKIARGRG